MFRDLLEDVHGKMLIYRRSFNPRGRGAGGRATGQAYSLDILAYVGVRECPYGICCPWVRGGWDLDALGKFFRRRRRRRHQGFRYFSNKFLLKVVVFSHFSEKMHLGTFIFKKVVFQK